MVWRLMPDSTFAQRINTLRFATSDFRILGWQALGYRIIPVLAGGFGSAWVGRILVVMRAFSHALSRLGDWGGNRRAVMDWFNHRRLLEPIGNMLPAEAEALNYRQLAESAQAA